jgi:hypothetical protein
MFNAALIVILTVIATLAALAVAIRRNRADRRHTQRAAPGQPLR